MGFKDEMEQYDEQWEEDAAKPAGQWKRLGDGQHQVQITESRVEHDDTSDTYTWITKFQNQEGSIRKWYNLDNEVGRSIAAQDSKMLGYEGKLSGLLEWVEAEDPLWMLCEIGVKTKPGDTRDYTNVYLNRVLGKAEPQDFGQAAEPANLADDDIPF